jgi:hypothetical protein
VLLLLGLHDSVLLLHVARAATFPAAVVYAAAMTLDLQRPHTLGLRCPLGMYTTANTGLLQKSHCGWGSEYNCLEIV